MYKFFLLVILALIFSDRIDAQTNQGIIPGTIKDINGKALYGGDLVLKDAKDSTVVKHTFSDTGGNFRFVIANIKDGAYLVSVQLIGYSKAKSPVFIVTEWHFFC